MYASGANNRFHILFEGKPTVFMLCYTPHRKMHADLFPPSKLHAQLSYITKSEQKKSLVTSQSIEVKFHLFTYHYGDWTQSHRLLRGIHLFHFNFRKSSLNGSIVLNPYHCVRLRRRGLLPEVCCTKIMDLRLNPSKQLCQNRSNCNFYHPRM